MMQRTDTFTILDGTGHSIQNGAIIDGPYYPYNAADQDVVLTNSSNLNGQVALDTSRPGFVRYIITTTAAVSGPSWVTVEVVNLPQAPYPTRVATTTSSGYNLINGTGTILSYTTPQDGRLHLVTVAATKVVSTAETGGACTIAFATAAAVTVFAGTKAVGTYPSPDAAESQTNTFIIQPGQTIALAQSTALTAGASTVYAEIWST